ncbi:hypothetical protein SAMN02745673_04116 [Marinactinospora thermotolerans DSM 45154]|uniref:Mce-associated membrane protein n=1 Tax=Marinactinospora thermotolerans DSM 45154 TaxID=1122192 RepID=A0A1T4SXR3_9ACTN|nr:hypothetical protein [Marinactinospora thermotolerans]SKA32986.1 hypothetical protein SAMN02745673_04116 [Marinactinospora thermotolerans DSM 45154]
MPKPLSDGAQRLVFGVLVVVLVAFGVYLSLGGFQGDGAEEEPQAGTVVETPRDPDGQAADAPPPSPIPTTDAQDADVMEWLPFGEEDFRAAAAVAQQFATAYGTIDYSESPEAYYDRMRRLATADYAETLANSSGAGALWGEMREAEAVAEGRASVDSVRGFDDDSIVFVVTAQSITEGSNGAREDLGDFAVTLVKEEGGWKVFDFQPADAGNLGGG